MIRVAQCHDSVLMVRPCNFGPNRLTALTNPMQSPIAAGPSVIDLARREFDELVTALRSEGVCVCVIEDREFPVCPDAVFPNNWISFHADGRVVFYPMLAPNRRDERRPEIVSIVCAETGFCESGRLDLTALEAEGTFLEGTGSLVLDRIQRVAFACRSPRTNEALVREWARLMNYTPVCFDAIDAQGRPYYHTNVMMWIGSRCAAVCLESIAERDRRHVLSHLEETGRELIELTRPEVAAFCGNMLELSSWDESLGDCSILLMSDSARRLLSSASFRRLTACVDSVLAAPIPTIERFGGGSVRCMVTEIPR